MSEELLQRGLLEKTEKIGVWDFYNIGATTITALKRHNIIPQIDYPEKIKNKKPDGLIVDNKSVIAIIENKTPAQLGSDKKIQKAIQQEIEVAKALDAYILIVTDTVSKHIWINPHNGERITDENGNEITIPFKKEATETITIIDKIIASVGKQNSKLHPKKFQDPTPLSRQIWQDIWSVSGATPENCLYTFVELFIFKYLSDLKVLSGMYSFNSLMKQYETNTDEQVLEYYAETVRKQIKRLFPYNNKDNTTIINGTIFVSKDDKAIEGYGTVLKKILRRFQDFGKLENIDHDFKSKLFESFLKESISKKNWGQFFTPLKVVQSISKAVDIKAGMKICDPACGVGKFLLEPIKRDINKFYIVDNNVLKPKITLVGYDKGFDRDEQKTIILAKANMLIYFSDLLSKNNKITKQFSDLFNNTFELKTNSILGTLREPVENEFDIIFSNPPYVTSGSSNLKEEIKKNGLDKNYPINALGVEGLFMEWIIRALKPDGKAFIVVPDGIMNRANDKKLRKFILDECIIDAVISLPLNTFFTTNKKTYILALTKKVDKSVKQIGSVFTYLVSDIGESLDVYRFETPNNHLDEAIIQFNQFKGSKEHYISHDKRCKIQSISKFEPENHWSVDRWWTESEKIELGIAEEKNFISLNDFSNLIGEISG
ncbi:class I SAM-dependent DNA methyltransferase, partial [Proteus terrae]|uniref:HsdM family class I SAM-dependent methyltransferase n=1 Tax=Proteus terrae TaxID=1574161 RepID=UPI001F31EA9A